MGITTPLPPTSAAAKLIPTSSPKPPPTANPHLVPLASGSPRRARNRIDVALDEKSLLPRHHDRERR